VRLFPGPGPGVDALDILLGVGIGSFPHKISWPNELTVRSTFRLCKYPSQDFQNFP
jgi:hypothetical protein